MGLPRNLLQVLTASPAVVVEATTAMVAPPGQHPRRRTPRLPPLTPRAPVPQWPHRQCHARVDARSPTATSPTRTQSPRRNRQAIGRRRRMQAPLGRALVTRCTKMVADVRPASTTVLLSQQHPCIFSINYFSCKTHVCYDLAI